MTQLWQSLNAALARGESVVAAAIVSRDGSSPGPTGARMLIFENADLAGTVGGGPLEGRAISQGAEVMAYGKPCLIEIDLAGEIADGSDAICGGLVHVFLERLDPLPGTVALFATLERTRAANQTCLLVSPLVPGAAGATGRGLLAGDGRLLAGDLPEAVARQAWTLGRTLATPVIASLDGADWFVEPLRARDTVYICGAGHIARPTAAMAAMADFKVVVLDDRAEFASPARFPTADAVVVLEAFDDCFAGIDPDPDSSIVIVSRCHKQDRKILDQALRTEAGYIGMIGSSRKVAAVLEECLEHGFPRRRVAAVHAPIGIPLGGDTPAEIGVSIVAELVKERVRRRRPANV